jgi:outer membrane protein OmpA-like peptidoglycan-associated protein
LLDSNNSSDTVEDNAMAAFRFLPLLVLISFGSAHAQQDSAMADATEATTANQLSYIGEYSRFGIGYDSQFKLYGEFMQIFAEQPDSAWVGMAWLADDDAGGLKLGYHWLQGDLDSGAGTVHKLFLAFDQNTDQDQKLTLGWGMEREEYFGNINFSHRLTGRRLISTSSSQSVDLIEGIAPDGRPFVQPITTTTSTEIYERAWDYGVGVRAGRFYPDPLVRVQAGLDYEWGEGSADQITASIVGEKLFHNSPHSLALHAEYYDRNDPVGGDRDDGRVRLMYRYDFGGPSYRPARVPVAAAPAVRNDISLDANAFFDFDRSELRAEARTSLVQLAEQLNQAELLSPIEIVGHTCNIGSDAYNQRDFLVSQGVPADRMTSTGRGEREPRYSNETEESRRRNRRVDISVTTVGELAVPAVMELRSEPVWIQRALRNPAEHKRTVDTYQLRETRTTTETGDPTFLTRPPVANDDSATTDNHTPITIDVLANDSDPDGDPLTIIAVGMASGGQVINNGGSVTYLPDPDFVGVDSFTYTVSDGQGGESSASVTVTVTAAADANQPPVANDDRAVTNRNTPVLIDVLANDTDPDGDSLTIDSVTSPQNGSAIIQNGRILYTPNTGFRGTDRFSYTVSDGRGGTDSANVTVIIPLY